MDLISKAKLQNIAVEKGFNLIYLEKDYYLTCLLYLIKDIDGLYFKGGTALNKIFFNHTRLSEDLDFTCIKKISEIKNKIEEIVKTNNNLFTKIGFDKEMENFTRMQIFYNSYFSKNEYVNIDLNSNAKVLLKQEKHLVPHFYKEIPEFEITTLNFKEIIAEKISALIGRNQSRDYFDAYSIIQAKIKIDMPLVRKKLKSGGKQLLIERIFKNSGKIYHNWEEETSTLTNKPISYKTAITTIAKYFKYKEKKQKAKNQAKQLNSQKKINKAKGIKK